MTKEELLQQVDFIQEELYEYIAKDSVDKYYLPALNEIRQIIKEFK